MSMVHTKACNHGEGPYFSSVLNVKAVVAAFNQSTNLRMDLLEALVAMQMVEWWRAVRG